MGGVGSESDDCNELEAQWSALVLGELRAHLVAVGYREVTEEERPDLMLFVGAVTGSEWDLSTPPTYCSDGGELFAGCWRATYSHPYNLPQNTVLIDLAVGKESRRGQLKSIWTAILQGFDPSAAAKNAELQIRAVVERAFTQSPYLQAEGAL